MIVEPQKNYTLPAVQRHPYEDAFDEIEILGFSVSFSPFYFLQTKYGGAIMEKNLIQFHKSQEKMLAYLISRKQVPTKRGTMYFGTWIDADGDILTPLTFLIT